MWTQELMDFFHVKSGNEVITVKELQVLIFPF